MRKNIARFLTCPICHSSLVVLAHKSIKDRIIKGELLCKQCEKRFDIKNEISCFVSIRKPTAKATSQENQGVAQVSLGNKIFSEVLPKEWKQLFSKKEFSALQKEWNWMLSVIKRGSDSIHLDFATGTGMFLRKLVFKIKGDVVALEHDYSTCRNLQYFLKRIGKHSKVSIVCADARNMPFGDGVFDSISSWHGLDESRMEEAIKEANRVLKIGGYFVASGIHYLQGSRSFQRAQKHHINFLTKEKIIRALREAGFRNIEHKVFFKGRWLEKGDYLPVFNDQYISYAIRGQK